MKIATWNVNGIRAREAQLREFLERERPDVVCLQEIKATPAQVPGLLLDPGGYWAYWHGASAYSGVALHVRRELAREAHLRPSLVRPRVPGGDRGARVDRRWPRSTSRTAGRTSPPRCASSRRSTAGSPSSTDGGGSSSCAATSTSRGRRWTSTRASGRPGAIGQRPDERELFGRILGHGLVDVGRHLHPDDDALFTWWAPWRNLRQRNIGWRIDYVLASEALAPKVTRCDSLREVGTSDHAPARRRAGAAVNPSPQPSPLSGERETARWNDNPPVRGEGEGRAGRQPTPSSPRGGRGQVRGLRQYML